MTHRANRALDMNDGALFFTCVFLLMGTMFMAKAPKVWTMQFMKNPNFAFLKDVKMADGGAFLDSEAFKTTTTVCTHLMFITGNIIFAFGIFALGCGLELQPGLAAAPAVTSTFVMLLQMVVMNKGITGIPKLSPPLPARVLNTLVFAMVTANVAIQRNDKEGYLYSGEGGNDTDSKYSGRLAACYVVAVCWPQLIAFIHRKKAAAKGWTELTGGMQGPVEKAAGSAPSEGWAQPAKGAAKPSPAAEKPVDMA